MSEDAPGIAWPAFLMGIGIGLTIGAHAGPIHGVAPVILTFVALVLVTISYALERQLRDTESTATPTGGDA